jgi:hypothetical protein
VPAGLGVVACIAFGAMLALHGADSDEIVRDAEILAGTTVHPASPNLTPSVRTTDGDIPPFVSFSGTDGNGRVLTISSAADCARLDNDFLRAWCQTVADATGPQLPDPKLPENQTPAANTLYFAVFARAVLAGDPSVCDWPTIDQWVRVSAHVLDGSAACRESLAYLARRGWFSVSDPASGETFTVDIGRHN